MNVANVLVYLEEFMYVLCGLVTLNTGIRALKNETHRIGTFLFWFLISIIFILGNLIPTNIIGFIIVLVSILTLTKQVRVGKFSDTDLNFKKEQADKLKNKIFLPAILIGVGAMVIAYIKFDVDGKMISVPSAVALGFGSILALTVGFIIARPKIRDLREDTSKLTMQVGATGFLPQLLAALGTVFTAAGVGEVISKGASGIVPESNVVVGVIIYVLAMVLFTMIMGNGFAAFSVITVGIGVPFVIMHGGNPAIVGALGMTSGFCGTLLTPMAANFNIVPTAILETLDKNTVIKAQAPVAIILIIVHIVLMLTLAF